MATSFTRQTVELHGTWPDLIPEEAPEHAWNTTYNLWSLNGETRRVAGELPVMGTPLTEPRTVCFYTDATGQPFWVYAGPGGIFVTDGALHHNITPAAGWAPGAEAIYTSESYNGFVVINASTLAPVYWPGATPSRCAGLPGWNPAWRCLALRPYRHFLVAIGMLNEAGFQRCRWSDAAEAGAMPQEWEPTEENLAGFVDLLPSHSPCIDAMPCRDTLLIFKGQSVHELAFVGGDQVLRARRVFTGVGLAGVNGIARGPSDQLLWIGSDGDLYRTDGVSYASVLDGMAQATFYLEASDSLLGSLSAVTLTRLGVSWLFYPTGAAGPATRAICFDWASGEVGFRDVPGVRSAASGRLLTDPTANAWDSDGTPVGWQQDPAVWNYRLTGSTAEDVIVGSAGPLLQAFENPQLGAAPPPAYALKRALSFGDPGVRKLARAVWPKIRGVEGDALTIRLGGHDAPGGPVTWSAPAPYVIGQPGPVELFASGRYLAIEISAEAGGHPWALASIDVELKGQGSW